MNADNIVNLPNLPVVWQWLSSACPNKYSILADDGIRMTLLFDSKYHAKWAKDEMGHADTDGSYITN